MPNKRKLCITLILASVMALCLIFASCITHQHEFKKWDADNDGHWKVCSCGEQIGAKRAHVVTSWTIDVEATAESDGSRHGACDECNYNVTEVISQLASHVHQTGEDYEHTSYSHFKRCATCGQPVNIEAHVVESWIIDEEATEHETGLKHGECTVCKSIVETIIPALDHVHVFVEWANDDDLHWKECSGCGEADEDSVEGHTKKFVVDTPATTTSAGVGRDECEICGKQFPPKSIPQLTGGTRTIDFYAINDFHGEVGKISTVGGYLKQQKNNNANTVLINSGDMFQGSMESNSNYGKLLTDCMDAIGFDAFTFGNHEFDWGLEKLESLADNSNVPFLGANIYHWNASSKTWGTFADELAQKYVIKQLDNGLKVGIIGVIGEKQITSISSNLVQTIGFKEPLPIIKELATELRDEKGCDVVVVSAHTSPRALVGEADGNNNPNEPTSAYGLESCVDAVFCAHTHQTQNLVVDGLPFVQGGSYGSNVSRVVLSVSSNGEVTCTQRENIAYSQSWPNIANVDLLINNANDQIKDERNQIVTHLNNSLNSNPAMARLVSRSIAEYAKNQGYNISLAMVNTARKALRSGDVTYSDLYESIPFDNVVYIAKVKGKDIINEVKYSNYFWRSSGEAIESDEYYTIAVIDYLLFHQSDKREYNYFSSAFSSGFTPVALTNDNYEVYNYRLITRDYLLANSINAYDYLYDNKNTDTTLLQSAVTLDYETVGSWSSGTTSTPTPTPASPKHAGTLADPYDVADAKLLGADYTAGNQAPSIYVKCTVSNVTYIKQSDNSGDLGNFYVEDENGNSIKVYYVSKSSSSANNWSSTDDLKVGDVLVMHIASYVYNGTPQLGYGYCVSVNGADTY